MIQFDDDMMGFNSELMEKHENVESLFHLYL